MIPDLPDAGHHVITQPMQPITDHTAPKYTKYSSERFNMKTTPTKKAKDSSRDPFNLPQCIGTRLSVFETTS